MDNTSQTALIKDWSFIFEALQKLVNRTCCDQEKGKICTWDLLPRIDEALQEHIALESKWLFPELSLEEKLFHESEHRRLQELLSKASWELECGYGDQFQTIAQQLLEALKQHDKLDLKECTKEYISDENFVKIKERIASPWSA